MKRKRALTYNSKYNYLVTQDNHSQKKNQRKYKQYKVEKLQKPYKPLFTFILSFEEKLVSLFPEQNRILSCEMFINNVSNKTTVK